MTTLDSANKLKLGEEIHNSIKESSQLIELSNDSLQQKELIDKINTFLDAYNKRKLPDEDVNTPWIDLSLKEIFRKTIQTAVDIINDVSEQISNKELVSGTEYRRGIVMAFTAPERRVYVGIWLIIFSFILYFIDSAA
jgi:hypothetical protein